MAGLCSVSSVLVRVAESLFEAQPDAFPVACSLGSEDGYGAEAVDDPRKISFDWDIVIAGRSLTEAVQPARACRQLLGLIDDRGKGAP